MERLTNDENLQDFQALKGLGYGTCSAYCDSRRYCKDCEILVAFNRLAAYEDTGLTPEEIKVLQESYSRAKTLIDSIERDL